MTTIAEALAECSDGEFRKVLAFANLTKDQAKSAQWDWRFWARPSQLPPKGDWLKWLILAGRGWGKTRVGSETVRSWMCGKTPLSPGRFSRIAIVAETAADARLVIVEGESGLLRVHRPEWRPTYHTSKRQLTWPNGAIATLYNATEPDQLRGPQHEAAWCDELAKWQYARETWDMLQFGLRLGERPIQVITTTPRPIPVLREIIASTGTIITRGNTFENEANLAPSFKQQILGRYEGTRLGRQELNAEILDDNPNALWKRSQLDELRAKKDIPDLARIVVAIDPSGTRGDIDREEAADVGIVVAGRGTNGHCYVLADRTCNLSPAGWGKRATTAYHEFKANLIIAERNFGGAMVQHVIQTSDPKVPYKEVTASRGKWVRAEPVAALYEQKKVHHVGSFPELEDEMCAFGPDGLADDRSPNRVDALVWAVSELMVSGVPVAPIQGHYGRGSR